MAWPKMSHISIVCLTISLLALNIQAYLKLQPPLLEKHKMISEAFKLILNRDFKNLNKSDVFLTVGYKKSEILQEYIFDDLASSILLGISKQHAVNVKFQAPIRFKSNEHYQLILADDFATLSYLYSKLKRIGTRNLAYTLVYFATVKTPEDPQITAALELLWKLNVLNVGLIIPSTEFEYADLAMITYFPYEPNHCEVIRPKLVNRFNAQQHFWEAQNFFPEKIRNFNGCPLISAVREDMPYFKIKRKPNAEVADLIGIEGRLLLFMATNLNFTIKLYVLNEEEILASYNDSGWIFEKLFRNNVKYAIGAFHYRLDLNEQAPYSQSKYYFVRNTYLVVNNIQRDKRYKKLLRPLQSQVWLLIGMLFGVGYAVILAHRYGYARGYDFIIGQGNTTPYYNMFVTFVGGQIVHPLPSRNFARYLLVLWLLTTLVLRGAYQSGLFEILRDRRTEEPPQTLNEVAAQNYVIAMIPENARLLTSLPEAKHVRFLNRTSELQAFPALAAAAERTALLTPYEYFGHFRKTNQSISRHLSLVRERIFAQPLSLYVQRNSFLLYLLNEQIAWAQIYGFIEIWKRQYMAERLESELGNGRATAMRTVQHAFDASTAQQTDVKLNILSLHELDTVFRICGYLLLFACGIFVAELFCAKLKPTAFK